MHWAKEERLEYEIEMRKVFGRISLGSRLYSSPAMVGCPSIKKRYCCCNSNVWKCNWGILNQRCLQFLVLRALTTLCCHTFTWCLRHKSPHSNPVEGAKELVEELPPPCRRMTVKHHWPGWTSLTVPKSIQILNILTSPPTHKYTVPVKGLETPTHSRNFFLFLLFSTFQNNSKDIKTMK
jgi:hypothetical protein